MKADEEITMTESELSLLIERAAEAGAKKALHDIGLHDDNAAFDVRELRGLLDSWRDAKRTAFRTLIGWTSKGLLTVLFIGLLYQIGNKHTS